MKKKRQKKGRKRKCRKIKLDENIEKLEKMPKDLEVVTYMSGAHNALKSIEDCFKERTDYFEFSEYGLRKYYDDCVKIY